MHRSIDFFFNDTATTEIYTLSLHDALPIYWPGHVQKHTTPKLYHNNHDGTFTDVTHKAGLDVEMYGLRVAVGDYDNDGFEDRKSTRLNSSHMSISYAVFCLKKKKKKIDKHP